MSKSYQTRRAKASGPEQLAVPAEATIALEEIAGSAKEGLLALAVGAGLQVMQVLMEEQVAALCGPRSKHNPGAGRLPPRTRVWVGHPRRPPAPRRAATGPQRGRVERAGGAGLRAVLAD